MVQYAVGMAVIILVYLCLLIVVFAPTIYAVWLYVVSRRVKIKRKGLFRVVLTTFAVNLVVAYFVVHLAMDYFLVARIAENDAVAAQALQTAVDSQRRFFRSNGRYYSVGPIRGPYQDDRGVRVEKDVIIMVEPRWDNARGVETFDAYALHVWGKDLLAGSSESKVLRTPEDSDQSSLIRSKLINSVK